MTQSDIEAEYVERYTYLLEQVLCNDLSDLYYLPMLTRNQTTVKNDPASGCDHNATKLTEDNQRLLTQQNSQLEVIINRPYNESNWDTDGQATFEKQCDILMFETPINLNLTNADTWGAGVTCILQLQGLKWLLKE